MENWIGAYRLPPNIGGLGVDRGPETPEAGGGVSPIPGSTPSPGLINMWSNAIKQETQNQHHQGLNATGSIKGKGRNYHHHDLPNNHWILLNMTVRWPASASTSSLPHFHTRHSNNWFNPFNENFSCEKCPVSSMGLLSGKQFASAAENCETSGKFWDEKMILSKFDCVLIGSHTLLSTIQTICWRILSNGLQIFHGSTRLPSHFHVISEDLNFTLTKSLVPYLHHITSLINTHCTSSTEWFNTLFENILNYVHQQQLVQ